MLGLFALIVWLGSTIALGQDVVPQTLFEGPAGPDNPICSVIEQAGMTWPIFGQIFGMLTTAALFLHPFSNLILKAALGLSLMPSPAAKTVGKVLWIIGRMASVPAAGTPPVMKAVYAGTIESPIKKKPLTGST